MPQTTYLGRGVAKLGAGNILPGSGDMMSSGAAYVKADDLKAVQQCYFHDTSPYKGGDIAVNDALQAIKYARSKKITKGQRKAVKGGITLVASVAGAIAGGTVGSVVPVAGTVAGGAIGAVALGTAMSGGITVLDQLKRKTKGLYKLIRGTRGEHRNQCARALVYCQGSLPANDAKRKAASAALHIILGEEYEEVMAMTAKDCEERLADRLKSN